MSLVLLAGTTLAMGTAAVSPDGDALAGGPSCSTTAALKLAAPSKAGDIDTSTTTACFTFGASAGDVVRVNVRATSTGFNPFTDIFSPEGISVCAGSGDLSCALDATGTWTAQVSSADSSTGTFDIYA
ncbi:MAG TPA: hypothetical protein VEJ87_00980, partial [Acidimicrobiales bacterium]|nr:hypothetical protein [Acidimicrobiales bacterium]